MEETCEKFPNPPVVEAWIEFEVDLADENVPWNEEAARVLIKEAFPEFSNAEFFGAAKVEYKNGQWIPSELRFDLVRAFNVARDRCVQAKRNALIFNQIKKGEWLGFENLQVEAFNALNKYIGSRHLDKLKSVCLHYRDIVKIPRIGTSGIDIAEYFQMFLNVPHSGFGVLQRFNFFVQLSGVCKDADTIVTLQSIPIAGKEATEYSFVMDWHVTPTITICNESKAKEWLEAVHKGIYNAFKSAFTEKGLDIFRGKKAQ